MKRIEKILISGFLLAVVFSFFGFSANCEGISNKVLRLHVLANSNSEYDQRIKLAVKDVVSQYAESLLSGAENLDESTEIINNNLQNIEHIANQKLRELHVHYEAKAIMKNAYFGTREYKDFSLPAGEYQALRILLGEASGKNWWCVVYPSLCISAAAEDFSGFSTEERAILQKPKDYQVSFKFYEWYQQMVHLWDRK